MSFIFLVKKRGKSRLLLRSIILHLFQNSNLPLNTSSGYTDFGIYYGLTDENWKNFDNMIDENKFLL